MTIRSTIAVGLHAFDQEISDMQNAVLELLGVFVSSILSIAAGGTNSGTALSGSSIIISNGTQIVQGAAGTTTTLLHGNAAGAPTYAAVSMTADVTGTLPIVNGGTGNTTGDATTLVTKTWAAPAALGSTTPAAVTCTTLTSNTAGAGLLTQETWIAVSGGVGFQNSWVDFDSGTHALTAYFKDSEGVIHLRGWVKSGTIGLVVFTLPSGYRPAAAQAFATMSAAAFGQCDIASNGDVSATSGNNAYFVFNGITFDTR